MQKARKFTSLAIFIRKHKSLKGGLFADQLVVVAYSLISLSNLLQNIYFTTKIIYIWKYIYHRQRRSASQEALCP
jgi:hypothetical protein